LISLLFFFFKKINLRSIPIPEKNKEKKRKENQRKSKENQKKTFLFLDFLL